MRKKARGFEAEVVKLDRDDMIEAIWFVYDDLGHWNDDMMASLESMSDKELCTMVQRIYGCYENEGQKVNKKECISIFSESIEDILNDKPYFNRSDETLLKKITVGYLMSALENHPEVKDKLTALDIETLIYSVACGIEDLAITDAIAISEKYDLNT